MFIFVDLTSLEIIDFFLKRDFEKLVLNTLLLNKIQNKKHAKVQNFMQIGCKILSLHALIFY
ncbi:hypothetical protein GCM10023311_12690 [Flaviramulus aquimarinus]|uniref:Uncharacterized protein n=1 Tax=Flaviramulus aquimarinus TaxID=1170456 RepID=A0ABP9F0G6_9FLAO